MKPDFYRAFEESHRGPRALIQGRQRIYLPFVETLRRWCQQLVAADLGCGRGEWLELLREQGVDALGIDLDEGMLSACRGLSLRVERGDALEWLARQASASYDMLTAFHLVEHLSFVQLDLLVQEAKRILRPGGLLLLETPNPENLVVASHWFYLDPTHIRPLPPTLLTFLAQYHGFHRSAFIRLPGGTAIEQPALDLIEVFGGVSPEYAVIAQQAGEEEMLHHFEPLFTQQHGQDLHGLAARYDAQQKAQFRRIQNEIQDSASQMLDQLERMRQEHEQFNNQMSETLAALRDSRSWRITAPLRAITDMARDIREKLRFLRERQVNRIHMIQQRAFTALIPRINARPRLKRSILLLAHRFPRLRQRFIGWKNCSIAGCELEQHYPLDLSPRQGRLFEAMQAQRNQSNASGADNANRH